MGTSVSFIFFAQDGNFAFKDKELCYHIVYFILFLSLTSSRRAGGCYLIPVRKDPISHYRRLVLPLRPSSVACVNREFKFSS